MSYSKWKASKSLSKRVLFNKKKHSAAYFYGNFVQTLIRLQCN